MPTDPPILSYDHPDQPAKLVRIGPFRDTIEANLAAGRLHDEGLRAHVGGEHLAATLGPVYGAAYAGGPFLLVPAEEAAAARAIVAEIEQARRDRNASDTPPCPACEHRPTDRVLHRLRWIALGLIAIAFLTVSQTQLGLVPLALGLITLVAPVRPTWRCPACRHRFAAAVPAARDEE